VIALVLAAVAAAATPDAPAPASAPATASAPLDPARRQAAVEQAAHDVLGRYQFCKDADYPLYYEEEEWCPHVGDPNARCPTLPKACKGGAVGYARARGEGSSGGKLKPGEEEAPPRMIELPSFGGLGQILFYLLIACAIAAIVYAIVRSVVGHEPAPERETARKEPETPAQAAAAARGPIETDVERLLSLARAAAERGEFDRALDFLYAALLRRLDGDGLIRIRPWRTNGDYLRDLRARPELRGDVLAIVREIERVQFGAAQASHALYDTLLGRVLPVVSRTLAALALIAFVFGAASCGRSRGPSDDTPGGSHAVMELLEKSGFTPHQRLTPLAKIESDAGTLVLLRGARVDAATWNKLLEWIEAGHTLVVANSSHHLPVQFGVEMAPEEWSGKPDKNPLPDGRVPEELRGELGDFTIHLPERNGLRLLKDSRALPLVTRGDTIYATETHVGSGEVVVLADDLLFTNTSLAIGDDPAFLVALLDRYNLKIEFSDEATGTAPPNPAAAIGHGKLMPVTLQLALLLALFFVYRGAAFGALRDPASASRRSFAEHARALGAQYAKAHATRHALVLYSSYVLDRLRETARLGGPGSLHRLAEVIALRTRRSLGDVMRLLVEARTARDQPDAKSVPSEDLATMRELTQLMKDIGGTREHR
jgi:hypothetical protein